METYKMNNITGSGFDNVISLFNNSIAEQYDSNKNYFKYNTVMYKGLLYTCIKNTKGRWDSSAWVEQKVFDNTINNVIYQDSLVDTTPLTITAREDNCEVTLNWYGNCSTAYNEYSLSLQYSTDNINWNDFTVDIHNNNFTVVTLANAGDKVYFRGDNNYFSHFVNGWNDCVSIYFTITTEVDVSGNIMSLLDSTCNLSEITEYFCFARLFGNNNIIDASNLKLPATTLADACYCNMFGYCISLTTPPELPSTTLADNCYDSMFFGCTSLTEAPELPATTLAENCYCGMFSGCTSLTTAPKLPATILADGCYDSMFYGCTSLTEAPELPATELAEECYYTMFGGCTSLQAAPELPATTLAENCYYSMLASCTSLTKAPELPATELTEYCYDSMFYGCTSLTEASELPAKKLAEGCYEYMFSDCTSLEKAPELPATELADYCYDSMFGGCTSLSSVKANFTEWNTDYTGDWLEDVSSTGTFYRNSGLPEPSSYGASTIPSGWTVSPAF